jgi:DNA-binding transcriptional LysR family regulator
VVRHGSFRRCAEELEITPVSVSEHIQALEHRLRCKIFSRRPGQAPTLTADGKSAYNQSKKTLDDVHGLIGSFDRKKPQMNANHHKMPRIVL